MSKATELLSMALCMWSVIPQFSAGQFVEEPQTANVTAGSEVVFTCRHSPDPNFYGWTIDGVSAASANISEIIMPMPVHNRLTILAIPEYNGSVIECVAIFLDGTPPQISSPAMLIVQDAAGGCNFTNGTLNGTLAIAFDVEPKSQNVVQEGIAEFQCHHTVANYTGFTLNGTSSNNFTQNVSTESLVLDGPGTGSVLIVGAIPVYHGTIVVCVAVIDNCPSQGSREAILLIQGPLQAVTKLRRGYIGGDFRRYSWDPPPTIDLTDVEPDIAYCITIHNITCGRNDLVISDCDIVDTFYRSQFIHPHLVYRVEVIPRSNVKSARNGTSLSINETFMDIDIELSFTRFKKDDDSDNLTVALKLNPNMMVHGNVFVPEEFTVTVTAIDGADKQRMSKVVRGQMRNITFDLPSRRLWEYEFLAYGCKQHLIGSVTISSHEIQNITYTPLPGDITVTGEFINGSAVNRTLVIVYSRTNESDVHYSIDEVEIDGHSFLTEVSGLQGSSYGIAVFVVEENGTVFPRAAAQPLSVNYTSEGSNNVDSKQRLMINYTSVFNSTGVCITCTFLESSTATVCVAVVHQRISQLNSSVGLMNIESCHKFTRSGTSNTASGCIEGVNFTKSQVGVVGGRRVTETDINKESETMKPVVVIVASVIGVLVAISIFTIITTVILCVVWNKKGKMNGILQHTVNEQEPVSAERMQNVHENDSAIVPPAIAGSFQAHEEQALLSDTDGIHPATDNSQTQGPPRPNSQRPRGGHIPRSRSGNPSHDTGSPQDPKATPLDDTSIQPADHQGQQKPVLSTSPNGGVSISDDLQNVKYTQSPSSRGDPEVQPIPGGDALFRAADRVPMYCDIDRVQNTQVNKGVQAQDIAATTPSIPCPPAADKVVYDEIDKFQNSQGQHYAMLAELHTQPTSLEIPDDLWKTQYSDVRPQVVTQTAVLEGAEATTTREQPNSASETSGDSVSCPFNLEQLFAHLLPVVSKWQDLGLALSLDDDILAEIYTNNNREEDCLRDMLERYMKMSDLKHNWEEMDDALRKVRDVPRMDRSTPSTPSLRVPKELAVNESHEEMKVTAAAVPVTENTETDKKEYRKAIETHMKQSDVKGVTSFPLHNASEDVVRKEVKPHREMTRRASARAQVRDRPEENFGKMLGTNFDQSTAEAFPNEIPEPEYTDDHETVEFSPGQQSTA